MRRQLAAVLFAGAFFAAGVPAVAHHSFAMFDQDNPIDLVGTVQEFKFTSPHTFILLQVKGPDGVVVWNLEGGAPSGLIRDGWTGKTLKPGDELVLKVDPLRSGAPGGAWKSFQSQIQGRKPDPGHPLICRSSRLPRLLIGLLPHGRTGAAAC